MKKAALLLALGESQGEAGVTELARRLGLHKSTASRLLAGVELRHFVQPGAVASVAVTKLASRTNRIP